MSNDDAYGIGPAMHALSDLKAFNALPADERRKAIRYVMERELFAQAVVDAIWADSDTAD